MANVSENYGTLEENMSEVRKLFEEERSLGWMVEMSDKEAQEACGEKLYIASLAVVTEKDEIRLVHDATNKVQVNNRIRVRDQARSPGARERRTLLREWQERRGGAKMFAVIGDASKAHRRIMVKKEDWGCQACRLEPGRVWLNTVGTYGLASAGYYLARLASGVVVRLFYYLLGTCSMSDRTVSRWCWTMGGPQLEMVRAESQASGWLTKMTRQTAWDLVDDTAQQDPRTKNGWTAAEDIHGSQR